MSKYGHIYEKRIIEKYLETHEGKCPHTNEPLTAQDMIAVKGTCAFHLVFCSEPVSFTTPLICKIDSRCFFSPLVSLASKIAKPRPAAATSIPGMLQLMQNEWDSLMLETFTLKQQLDSVRAFVL